MPIQDVRHHVPKLRALHDRFAKRLDNPKAIYLHPTTAAELHAMFAPIRDELRKVDVFADLVVRPPPKVTPGTDNDGLGYIVRGELVPTLEDIAYVLQILEHPMTAESPIVLNREGLFVAGQSFDAMRSIADILGAAKKTIVIVDGYVGDATLSLCANKQPAVTVEILTYTQSTTPTFKTLADAFNKQHGGLAVRTSRAFHDRFIVIDGTEYFHVGSSIKDAGSRGFMFSRIEEPSVQATFDAAWTKEWTAATVFV
jgi:hypothetical protein